MSSIAIREQKVKPVSSAEFREQTRFYAGIGCGTFSMQFTSSLTRCAVEAGASKHLSFMLGLDNNIISVENAVASVARLKPTIRERIRHPLRRRRFRVLYERLPGLRANIGFNRSLEQSLEAVKMYHGVIREAVSQVRNHDVKCGAYTSFQIRPTSLAGGHAGAPQWLLNLETLMQGMNGFKIGVGVIPKDPPSLRIFKQVFPLMLASNRYGYDTWILLDNNLENSFRSIQKQDELLARGIITTLVANSYDQSQPAAGDIWYNLAKESQGFIGAAAVEEPLVFRRRIYKPWKKYVHGEVVIEQLRRSILRVMEDPRTRLVEAEPEEGSMQIIAVTGRANYSHYQKAIDKILFPRNVSTVFTPSKTKSIFVTRFFPAKKLDSINRLWNLGRNQSTLPDKIIQNAVAQAWPIVEKTADFAGVSPEVLLEGK